MAPTEKVEIKGGYLGRQRKRQKVQSSVGAKSSTLDQLPWKEVPFPNQFDDAEGFFGLEEISDVEVTKGDRIQVVHRKRQRGIAAEEDGVESPCEKQRQDEDDSVELKGVSVSQSPRPESDHIKEDGVKGSNRSAKVLHKKKTKFKDVKHANGASNNSFEALDDKKDEFGDTSAWNSLGLSEETLSTLSRLKFSQPTPIQQLAIPEIVSGHDVIGKASTGSGKTLAFGVPIYEHFLKANANKRPSGTAKEVFERKSAIALVVSPTRELAHQLTTHLNDLCSSTSASVPIIATVTGGLSLHKQRRLLASADIIIGTPGRLWEVMSADAELTEGLKRIKFLVLDEADRLLSEGHFREVEDILNALDRDADSANDEVENTSNIASQRQRQTLVFSATFQKNLQRKLAGKVKHMDNDLMRKEESMQYLLTKLNFREEKPKFLDVNPVSQMAENLTEGLVECAGLEKPKDLYLYAILLHHVKARTLVFVNSITSVRRLTPLLQNMNLQVHALHSQMPQKARLRSVERFSSPSSPSSILVATDVAARGLDIPSVQLIMHYHVPRAADTYVHRSGRTARAQNSGSSILLCAPEEVQGVRRLVAKVHSRNEEIGNNSKMMFIRTVELDRRVIARIKIRVMLSKKIADASLAKEKKGHEDNWLRTAAEDLGVDYDSDQFAAEQGTQKGRGQGRKLKEKEARSLSRDVLGTLKAQLRDELKNRINVGVSERYLSAGGVDIDGLLEEKEQGQFLGKLDMDDFRT